VTLLAATAPLIAAPPPGHYLVWADEFNGTAFDPTIWAHRNLGPRGDAVVIQDAVTVTNGKLVITTYTSNSVHYTGMIGTQGRFSIKYGYLEAAIDFDAESGTWGAFWLQSRSMGSYIGEPEFAGTEIDIVEHRKVYGTDGSNTNIENQAVANVHWDGYGVDHKRAGSGLIGSGLGKGFHTYGLSNSVGWGAV
jgi:beta-glucanase (GH16 family)